MPYSRDDLIRLANNISKTMQKPKSVEVVLIIIDTDTHNSGWISTIKKEEMLSVVSDVLDDIICQDGGKP